MHLTLALITILAAWKYADWKNWQQYHSTMMYFALGNLLYNFLTANHFLWKLKPDFLPNHSLTEMVYTFIIFPATVLLFLSTYPKRDKKLIGHYLKWIGIYVGVEWFFMMTGRIIYQYGWSLYWSIIFDILMFPMLRLFYKRTLLAYAISLLMCIFWVWYFKVPVNVPIEKRH
ncbi:CBO0543 family protein [Paenibacillus solisilvae]|uniref:CBO0543 family protein n=1 Tax=Paenibacillus solisilvae TaxID=2486751 RepID=A0ABW0W6G9_9BACL